jgi:sulfite reductase beta subunit-like hemoprotein
MFEPSEKVRVKISGCLNGCSQHAIADIGLEGIALSKEDKWFPAYRVWLGGEADQDKVEFGRQAGIIPSRQVPAFLSDILACYRHHRAGSESFGEVLRRVGQTPFAALVGMYADMFELEEDELEWDWGSI